MCTRRNEWKSNWDATTGEVKTLSPCRDCRLGCDLGQSKSVDVKDILAVIIRDKLEHSPASREELTAW